MAIRVLGGISFTNVSRSPNWLPRLVRAPPSISRTSSTGLFESCRGAKFMTDDSLPFTLTLKAWGTWPTLSFGCCGMMVTTARPCPCWSFFCANAGEAARTAPALNAIANPIVFIYLFLIQAPAGNGSIEGAHSFSSSLFRCERDRFVAVRDISFLFPELYRDDAARVWLQGWTARVC